jgi:hypothetical protein
MNPDPSINKLEVSSIGTAALDWVSSGQNGEVVAAVSRALYLTTNHELYWITGASSPMHRRCLRISSPIPNMAVGSNVHISSGIPGTEGVHISLDLRCPPTWQAPTLSAHNLIPWQSLASRAAHFYQQFLEYHQPAGLGCLVPAILHKMDHASPDAELETGKLLPSAAWPVVERIISVLRSHDLQRLSDAAVHLVGLGEGLTPSGDDLLGGLFYCLRLLENAYPDDFSL